MGWIFCIFRKGKKMIDQLFPLFSSYTGVAILLVYGLFAFAMTYWYSKGYASDKTSFLVARRELGTFQGSLSVAAAWLWAPGLFISTQQAYVNGLVGLFWFCLGNFLTLGAFAYFAKLIRDREPNGFTFSGYLRTRMSPRVQWLFVVEMLILAVCAFAINLIAGSTTVATLTGINYSLATVLMASIAILYSFRTGLKATVITEVIKIIVVWTGVIILVPWAISAGGGWETVVAGLGGKSGQGASIFGTPFSWGVFTGFGAAAFLGHMGGPWGDNSFYQRAFSIKSKSIIPSYIIASFVFIVIPIMMGLLGFLAAGAGLEIPNNMVGNTNAIVIGTYLPGYAAILFAFMIFAGLVSILDSQFASVANMTGHDIYNQFKQGNDENGAVTYARYGMIVLVIAALIVANLPGMSMVYLFLFFAILRAAVWLPSMIALLRPTWVTEAGMFWGILIAAIPGESMYIYAKLYGGGNDIAFAGTLLAIFGAPLFTLILSKKDRGSIAEA
jgi:urea-proton symporter